MKKLKYILLFGILVNCNRNEEISSISIEKKGHPNKYISKIFDYQPAVGQYINIYPEDKNGDTEEIILNKVNLALVNNKQDIVSLGGFGGYIIFGFDHDIPNKAGRDFKILGNAFNGSAEPGIVYVSNDENNNNLPDDIWYEIAGSEYLKISTIKNYKITYTKIDKYYKWIDNQGNSGVINKNDFHQQDYFPLWKNKKQLTFEGTKLENNFTENNGIWIGKSLDFGYADNAPNDSEASNFDISWAINSNGKPANLHKIRFIKVQTGIHQIAGWLGEVSTEIKGAEDLHSE